MTFVHNATVSIHDTIGRYRGIGRWSLEGECRGELASYSTWKRHTSIVSISMSEVVLLRTGQTQGVETAHPPNGGDIWGRVESHSGIFLMIAQSCPPEQEVKSS